VSLLAACSPRNPDTVRMIGFAATTLGAVMMNGYVHFIHTRTGACFSPLVRYNPCCWIKSLVLPCSIFQVRAMQLQAGCGMVTWLDHTSSRVDRVWCSQALYVQVFLEQYKLPHYWFYTGTWLHGTMWCCAFMVAVSLTLCPGTSRRTRFVHGERRAGRYCTLCLFFLADLVCYCRCGMYVKKQDRNDRCVLPSVTRVAVFLGAVCSRLSMTPCSPGFKKNLPGCIPRIAHVMPPSSALEAPHSPFHSSCRGFHGAQRVGHSWLCIFWCVASRLSRGNVHRACVDASGGTC